MSELAVLNSSGVGSFSIKLHDPKSCNERTHLLASRVHDPLSFEKYRSLHSHGLPTTHPRTRQIKPHISTSSAQFSTSRQFHQALRH